MLNKDMYTSSEKYNVRKVLLQRAAIWGCRNMLTLAGPRGADARLFAEKLKTARVVSVEVDARTFIKQQVELSNYRNILCIKSDLSYFLANMLDKFPDFDCVFFDYNGIYKKSVEDNLINLFSKGLHCRNSVFGITLAKGRDGPEHVLGTRLLSGVCCNNYSTYRLNREEVISTTICQLARAYNLKCKPVFTLSYKNKGRGMPMMAFIFDVINYAKKQTLKGGSK